MDISTRFANILQPLIGIMSVANTFTVSVLHIEQDKQNCEGFICETNTQTIDINSNLNV